jgi:cyanophycin synthetase
MEIRQARFLVGPNVWSLSSVLEAHISVADCKHLPAERLAAFEARLADWLPGPWLAPRYEVAPMRVADVLVSLALELQRLAGNGKSWSGVGPLGPDDTLALAFTCDEERLGRACLESAQRMCAAALGREEFDVQGEGARLRSLAEDVCLGRATGPLVAAARAKGIPFRRLDGESLVQLGYGARRRRIRTSVTERTGKIAEWISLDKALSKSLLGQVGIPVPVGRRVSSAEEAWAVACALGLPAAVKPVSADYGHGVGLHLSTREQVVAAFAAAREYRDEVLVERFIPGAQYRLTVVGNRMVAAVRREPVRLTGDGQHTISELMEIANRDPRRGDDLRLPLTKVCPDDDTAQVLAEQGFALDSVLPMGREVVLSRIAHSWAGAGVTDVTDQVHPRVARQCVRAARLIGLDVAGLDVLAEDIGRPLEEQGGAILEVNAEPTIAFHFPPLCDSHRPVCEAIIDSLFPDGSDGRIPLALLTGPGPRGYVGRVLAELLQAPGREIGRTADDGLFIDHELVKPGNQSDLAGSLAALLCPEVDVAVLDRDLATIRDQGLGIDRVDVVVVTRLGPTADAEQVRAAKVALEAVSPTGALVIHAADQASRALAVSLAGNTLLVGPDLTCIEAAGLDGAALLVGDRQLVFRSRDRQEQVVRLDPALTVPSGADTDWPLAVAAAWAMGAAPEAIGARLPLLLREWEG